MGKWNSPMDNPIVRDAVHENSQRLKRQEAASRRAEKRAARKASDKRSKSLPAVCRFDNWLHDVLGQPRNY